MTLARIIWKQVLTPLDDLTGGLARLADARRPMAALFVSVATLVASWFVYVPIHELLHAGGCVAVGGSVTQLEIAPQYGGALVARWFPFVVSGGEYAGRLSGFDWKGSDFIYLVTDFAPYLLTVFIGVPLLRFCGCRRRALLFGVAVVVGLAPFYNIIGDYYEMGSIVVTRMVSWLSEGDAIAFVGIRSDDVFKLAGTLITEPETIGLDSSGQVVWAAILASISFLLGIILATATYLLGDMVARAVVGRAAAWETSVGTSPPQPEA